MKIALKYSAYSLIPTPISVQKKLPGNIGDGISSDANKNKKTKAMRMTVPLIVDYLSEGILNMFCFLVDSPRYPISQYLINLIVYPFNMNTKICSRKLGKAEMNIRQRPLLNQSSEAFYLWISGKHHPTGRDASAWI